jgi:hypothetical protein
VIEKVARVRAEAVEINRPTANRNRNPNLVLLITFALERKKPEALLGRQLEERPGDAR